MLGKLTVPGRPTILDDSRALAVDADGGCLVIFSPIYLFSFLSLSLWETARYRLKYCLKGPLNPTNQLMVCVILSAFLPLLTYALSGSLMLNTP